jgi:uncharacterized membrane protein YagU involved in acid resistance
MKRTAIPRAVFNGGTIGGALDLLFALVFAAYDGVAPVRLLQTVASGALGEEAFAGGAPTAILGLLCHFGLSYLWALLFVAAALRLPRLLNRPLVAGAVFGVLVFLCMRLIVLPLSAFPRPVSFEPLASTLDLLSHMFLFGVPIAAAASKALGAAARR